MGAGQGRYERRDRTADGAQRKGWGYSGQDLGQAVGKTVSVKLLSFRGC